MAFSKTCLIVWKCIEIWRSISISFRPQAITSFTAKKSAGHRTWDEITFAFIFYQYFIFGPSISIVKYHTHFEYTSCDLLYFAACPTYCLDWRRRNCLSSLDLQAVPPKTYWADSSSVFYWTAIWESAFLFWFVGSNSGWKIRTWTDCGYPTLSPSQKEVVTSDGSASILLFKGSSNLSSKSQA